MVTDKPKVTTKTTEVKIKSKNVIKNTEIPVVEELVVLPIEEHVLEAATKELINSIDNSNSEDQETNCEPDQAIEEVIVIKKGSEILPEQKKIGIKHPGKWQIKKIGGKVSVECLAV